MKTYNSPFNQVLDQFLNQNLSDVFGVDMMRNRPSVNIREEKDEHILELAVPGVKKEDIDISIEQERIIVQTKNGQETEGQETEESIKSDKKYNRKEFNYTNFKRSFQLPKGADVQKISAKYEAGVLVVTIAKKEEAKDTGPININVL